MTQRTFRLIYALAALAFLVAGAAATRYVLARTALHECPFCQAAAPLQDWSRRTDLTPVKKERLSSLESSYQKGTNGLLSRLSEGQTRLCSLLETAPADSPTVDEQVDRVAAIRKEQDRLAAHHLLDVREVLTPDQRAGLFSAMKKGVCQPCELPGE